MLASGSLGNLAPLITVPTKTQLSNFLGTSGEDYFKGNPKSLNFYFLVIWWGKIMMSWKNWKKTQDTPGRRRECLGREGGVSWCFHEKEREWAVLVLVLSFFVQNNNDKLSMILPFIMVGCFQHFVDVFTSQNFWKIFLLANMTNRNHHFFKFVLRRAW